MVTLTTVLNGEVLAQVSLVQELLTWLVRLADVVGCGRITWAIHEDVRVGFGDSNLRIRLVHRLDVRQVSGGRQGVAVLKFGLHSRQAIRALNRLSCNAAGEWELSRFESRLQTLLIVLINRSEGTLLLGHEESAVDLRCRELRQVGCLRRLHYLEIRLLLHHRLVVSTILHLDAFVSLLARGRLLGDRLDLPARDAVRLPRYFVVEIHPAALVE